MSFKIKLVLSSLFLFLFLYQFNGYGETMTMPDEMKGQHFLKVDSSGALNGMEISDKIDGKPLHGYLSKPDGKGPFPAIIMIHEWWGLNKHIKETADKLSKNGFVVFAVDLYKGKVATNPDEANKFMGEVNKEESIDALAGAYSWLKKYPASKDSKIGTIGWCFGGGYSLQAGLNLPKVDAVVIYYGLLESDPKVLSKLKGPVLGIFANQDGWINTKMVNDFETGLKEAKVANSINRYDADHAFANPSNPKYNATAEADAWGKTVEFFSKNLKSK
ncbi:MAG: dienelactone hydrolase family protein [Nitrospirae bacterium]|nr:dienelactone hydrolase family protein [Nitrospirota bacterium]